MDDCMLQHQSKRHSTSGRCEQIIHVCKDYFGNRAVKLLSFGCATGEEAFDLHNAFPKSQVMGYDVVTECVVKAAKKYAKLKRMSFTDKCDIVQDEAPYDAVFIMSVLCKWGETEGLKNCSSVYPFCRFDGLLNRVDELVKPCGLLAIYNANYCFKDATIFPKYRVFPHPILKESGFVTKFKRNGEVMTETYPHSLFQKKC